LYFRTGVIVITPFLKVKGNLLITQPYFFKKNPFGQKAAGRGKRNPGVKKMGR
jgi:hypothetical protein